MFPPNPLPVHPARNKAFAMQEHSDEIPPEILDSLRALFAGLAGDLDDPAFIHDGRGRIVAANQAFARTLGLPLARVQGSSLADFWPAEVVRSDLADHAFLTRSEFLVRTEHRLLGAGWREVIVSKRGLPAPDGGLAGILVQFRAKAVDQARDHHLLQAQKLQSLGKLTAGIVHDFNNVLTIMSGHLEVLREPILPGSSTLGIVQAMTSTTEYGMDLTRRLLAHLRNEPRDVRPIDLRELLADLATLFRHTRGRHITVELVLGSGELVVNADRAELFQVFLNLGQNACDAMPQGGSLRLECEQGERGDHPGPSIRLRIRDTGEGFPPAQRSSLTPPFSTTKPPGRGTGLGLSVVVDILQQLHGTIDFTSEPGRGACVTVHLPVVTPTVSLVPPLRTVVVADGDPEVRRLTGLILDRGGYHAILLDELNSLAEVLETVQPDLLILDEELLPDVADRVPAVLFTGSGQSVPPGCDLLRKPYDANQLLRAVSQALREETYLKGRQFE